MKKKSLKIAVSIITIGIILAIAANLFFSIQKSPAVTEHVFDFSVTYKLDGEVKTLDGKYACNFSGFGRNGIDPIIRYYDGEYAVDGVFTPSRTFTVAQKGEHTLYISVLFNEYFLMGDEENYPDHSPLEDPHIYIKDAED
ncbi:MAG: hypothetical protein IKU61_04590, partial [Clostridia bacterium]|nr:hypothetical protein [Clostridia bacterium]